MNQKDITTVNNLKRYLAFGGLGLTFLGLSYYLVRRSKKKVNQLPKDLVLKILNDIRMDLCPILADMALTRENLLRDKVSGSLSQREKDDILAQSKSQFFSSLSHKTIINS